MLKSKRAAVFYDLFKNKFQKQPLKLFYTGFVPPVFRASARRIFVDYHEQNMVARKWIDYLKFDLDFDIFDVIKKNNEINSNVIWQYWGQGLDNIPDVVRVSYASVDKYAAGQKVIRLTDDSVHEYIGFPKFFKEKLLAKKFRVAHYSDILRLALLYHYGGVWIDSTVVLTEELSAKYLKHDFFMFSRDPSSPYKNFWDNNSPYFDWRPQSYVRHLTSFIVGKAGDKNLELMLKLMFIYWENENCEGHYFFWNILCQLLAQRKLAFMGVPNDDDAVPHLLAKIIDDVYDKESMEAVIQKIGIHKLSHGNSLNLYSGGKRTNFYYLLEMMK